MVQAEILQNDGMDHLRTLSERELEALKKFREDRQYSKDYPLSPIAQAKLFELYLNGKSCEEIQKLNTGFSLGQVVDSFVEGKWEQRRKNHINRLLSRVKERVVQVQSEAVEFMADMMSAAHKLHGEKLKKYLQSGNEADLGEMSINSLDKYRKAAEIILKLTGQNPTQRVEGNITHNHVLGSAPTEITTKEQSKLLAELAGKK